MNKHYKQFIISHIDELLLAIPLCNYKTFELIIRSCIAHRILLSMHLLIAFLTMIQLYFFDQNSISFFLPIPLLFVNSIFTLAHECGKKQLKLKFKQGLDKMIYVIKIINHNRNDY